MPRPKRCRRICGYPDFWSFAPEDGERTETVLLPLEEYETIRLIDYQKKTQEECAAAMGVSRATVAAMYGTARFKLADAMVNGKRLRITGGAYRLGPDFGAAETMKKGEKIMRIAVPYEQGRIWQHFGRTERFKLYDAADGEIRETRILETSGTGHGALAGFLRAAQVDVLLCGGIGAGARMALEEAGVSLLPGAEGDADAAVRAYLAGTLAADPDAVCHEHDGDAGHGCLSGGDCGAHGGDRGCR